MIRSSPCLFAVVYKECMCYYIGSIGYDLGMNNFHEFTVIEPTSLPAIGSEIPTQAT